MEKIFWTQIKYGSYSFDRVPVAQQALVKEYAKDDVAAGVIDEERYALLIGEAYEGLF